MPNARVLHSRPFVAALGAVASWFAIAHGQVAPDGRHHASVGPGTGIAQNGSPTGGYAASVPLDLPNPRGPLPVPVSIVYTGAARAGAAGVGWDVPLTFVRRQVSTWRRRPTVAVASDNGPERIQLGLGGATQYMVPRADGVFVPYAGGEYLELRRSGSDWKLRTLDNLEYTFSERGEDLWLATEIRDLVGTDHVELGYTGWGDLESVRYTYGLDDKKPLYEVKLVHELYDGAAFDSVVDDTRRFSRSHVVKRVEVRARDNHVPMVDPKIIRTYHLRYEGDYDTGKPRLREVTTTGEAGIPGNTLPVATYEYGSLTSPGKPDINFGGEEIVHRNLPAAFQGDLSTTKTDVQELTGPFNYPDPGSPQARARRETSSTRHVLRDFTGDGLPDLVYKEGNTWSLVANRLDTTGRPRLDGPITAQWSQPAELHVETTFRFAPPTTTESEGRWARERTITTETWTTFVDWNGDGRLDVVDARAGAATPNPERTWRIWINQATPSGGIQWRPFDVRIDQVRSYLADHGFDVTGAFAEPFSPVSTHLPLARTRSWPRVNTWDCRSWDCTGGGVTAHCDPAQECEWGPEDFDPNAPTRVDTMTDWQLADQNGDGYLDFLALDMPVRHCEFEADHVGGPEPGLPGYPRWSSSDCESGNSPIEQFGNLGVFDGTYSCATEHHEWISSKIPTHIPRPTGRAATVSPKRPARSPSSTGRAHSSVTWGRRTP